MEKTQSPERRSWFSRIGEDWCAVIVGFVLIALVVLGVLGPVPW